MSQTQLTVTEASKLYKKQRKTLYRHIEKGQLSCTTQADGNKRLDLSELIRVYGEPPSTDTSKNTTRNESGTHGDTGQKQQNDTRIEALIDELKTAHASEREAWAAARANDQALLDARQEIIDMQRRLLPSPDQATRNRPWWKFWKRN